MLFRCETPDRERAAKAKPEPLQDGLNQGFARKSNPIAIIIGSAGFVPTGKLQRLIQR
jgi:hypothetical protein